MKRKILNFFVGKKQFQKFFTTLLFLSCRGLNYAADWNFYKNGELRLLENLKKRYKDKDRFIIFDVGGNVGDYARAVSEIFGEQALIYSFEPSKSTHDIFFNNNKDIDNIILDNIGFSDKEEVRLLYTDNEGSGLASVYERGLEHVGINMNKKEEITLSTIDSYCEKNNIEKIHFLKIDVEGHELSVLHGAERMLSENRIEIIQFEFGGCNIDSRTYFKDFYSLLKDNYRIYRILTNGMIEVTSYTECWEIFHMVNFVAMRKN